MTSMLSLSHTTVTADMSVSDFSFAPPSSNKEECSHRLGLQLSPANGSIDPGEPSRLPTIPSLNDIAALYIVKQAVEKMDGGASAEEKGISEDDASDSDEGDPESQRVSSVAIGKAHTSSSPLQEASPGPNFAARRLAEQLCSRYSTTASTLSISAKCQSTNIVATASTWPAEENEGLDERSDLDESHPSAEGGDDQGGLPTLTPPSLKSCRPRPANIPAPLIDWFMSESEGEDDDGDDDDEGEPGLPPAPFFQVTPDVEGEEAPEDAEDHPFLCSQKKTPMAARRRLPKRQSGVLCRQERQKARRPPKRQSGNLCRGSGDMPGGDVHRSPLRHGGRIGRSPTQPPQPTRKSPKRLGGRGGGDRLQASSLEDDKMKGP